MRLILLALLAAPLLSRAQGSLSIDIFLSNPDAGGKVLVAVCPSKEAYDEEKGCLTKSLDATGPKVRAFFLSLPAGPHAVKVFHDVNANGKLDTNKIGIPNEPYGFGNDARGRFGPPSF
ncbi:MAG TPA: DUF2141 domain-containing protein, partial [Flavobacteriales bacterium]|nr:DUF2141 domain-containing protein [Flavobacteriales bacterium]